MPAVPGADDYRETWADGTSSTELALEETGRVLVRGYDGSDLMHCTSHTAADAVDMAEALRLMAAHSREAGND
ncbi:hypothetical protein ACTWPB_07430 [Nocardia sp. IBHARD005]|uniref:hypothetical protein n=1 Tax=Nocardia sp. IBHARD005 TaxID=3457765 RepID=UPI004058B597